MAVRYKTVFWRKRVKHALRRPFEWLGILLGMAVMSSMTHRMLFGFCDFMSMVMWRFDRRGRELALRNLEAVYGRAVPAGRAEKIVRRSYRNMARTVGHVFWTSRRARARAEAVGEFDVRCRELLAANRPLVTVSAHLGCWEILSQLVFLEGHRMVSVAKDIGTPAMTRLLMRSRKSIGQEIVHADGAFRPLMQALKDGADVGLLVDQAVDPKAGGVWVKFFGRPMPVSAAPAFLSAKAKTGMIVAWSRPLKDGRYRCEFVNYYPYGRGVDIWRRTQECVRDLEGVIRRHPSCWVLNYRYFRKEPTAEELAQLDGRFAQYSAGSC